MKVRMSKIRGVCLALPVAFLLAALAHAGAPALAHEGATGVVKQRMDLMERFDTLMDRIFAMLRGEIPYHAPTVRKAALEIRD